MPQTKISLILFATFIAAAASAQTVYNSTSAEAYNPLLDQREQAFANLSEWDAAGRETNLVSTSESHPWDPPINIATAMSHFTQPDYKDATVRSMSFVLSDYTPAEPVDYRANTFFLLTQHLEVDLTNVAPGFPLPSSWLFPCMGSWRRKVSQAASLGPTLTWKYRRMMEG